VEALIQLLEKLPLAAQVWEPGGSVRMSNRAFNAVFGLPAEHEWAGAGTSIIGASESASSSLISGFKRALAGETVELDALVFQIPSFHDGGGSAAHISLTVYFQFIPIVGSAGTVSCVVCIAHNHSLASEQIEREMMRSQRMENLETLAASVAHEFNNLFTGIRGLADLIKDDVEQHTEVYEYAGSIQSSVLRGAELITRLNSFAKELPHTLRVRNLNDYISKALPFLQLQVTKRIRLTFVQGEPASVLLDAGRMDQAISNVLANAKEALGTSGRVLISTTIQSREEPDGHTREWAVFEIEDSGPGIPAALRDQVTAPFFTTKERGKATGLGLAMTQRIVLLHDGLLEIDDSARLGGTAVRILLPMVTPKRP
jgi:signal transduction histidine kinase